MRIKVGVLMLLLACPLFPAAADVFAGKVVSVTDGDTIAVLREGARVKVRLTGLDCPEKNQAFGAEAARFTSSRALGKTVTVTSSGRKSYGRLLGEVALPDGTSLNEALVRRGFAWHYRQGAPSDKTLKAFEREAKLNKRGLWRDADAVAPWEFRWAAKSGPAGEGGGVHVTRMPSTHNSSRPSFP